MMKKKLTVAAYLVDRLRALGVTDYFGVPGDFNFNMITAIEEDKETKWVGCCNELNAGYAADGYARIKGIGAVVTTMGVGELSAVNAVAGSYAENVPVIKIVGTPALSVQNAKVPIHHTLGNGDYGVYQRMYAEVTAANAFITQENAVEEIDRVIETVMTKKLPGYINLPADVCLMKIEAPEGTAFHHEYDKNNLKDAVSAIAKQIQQAENPVIVADYKVLRFGLKEQLQAFIEQSNLPATTLVMGKGAIDEKHPNFIGTYNGELINPDTKNIVESSDLIIAIGCLLNDTNSAAFSVKRDKSKTINIQDDFTEVFRARYENVPMADLLVELTNSVTKSTRELPVVVNKQADFFPKGTDPMTYDYLLQQLEGTFEAGDTIMVETGTVMMGASSWKLPSNVEFHNQGLWMSIGYATPATLGAGMAAPNNRLFLITGEGSHQLTAQEISNMYRNGLKPIIIVIDNKGYTIERYLCDDPFDAFNEIACWNYEMLPEAMGIDDAYVRNVYTVEEFDTALKQAVKSDRFSYITVQIEEMDAPNVMKVIRSKREQVYNH
ncbi:alpha-keto acid decarboxylase family protein [Sediminitomix flava]|nr:thiamine pyrophosphate-binding protein [Sediminitomix flava]